MIEILFHETEVRVSGFAEVDKFVTFKFKVFASSDLFVDTRVANFVAHGELTRVLVFILPIFVPDPDIFAVMKEFATMPSWNRPKNSAAKL